MTERTTIRRFLIVLPLAAVLGLSGCGGSTSHSPTAATAASNGSLASSGAGASSDTTTATGGANSTGPSKSKRQVKSTATATGPGTTAASTSTSATGTTSAADPSSTGGKGKSAGSRTTSVHRSSPPKPTTKPVPIAKTPTIPNGGIPPSAQVSGPTPISCLQQSNLQNARATEVSEWEAFDPTNNKPVFVDGPYKDASQANASAQSLNGIEEEASGGLYVVTAEMTSNLSFQVNAVAKCLSATNGQGVLSF